MSNRIPMLGTTVVQKLNQDSLKYYKKEEELLCLAIGVVKEKSLTNW